MSLDDKSIDAVWKELKEMRDIMISIRNDRRWVFALLVVGVVVIGIVADSFSDWSKRLVSVESKIDAHVESSTEIHDGLRRDIIRNTVDIDRLKQKNWEPVERTRK